MWDYFPYQGSNPLPWNHGVSTTGLPGKSQGPICFCFSVYPQHLAHYQFSHFNHSVVSDSLLPHGLQYTASLSITNSRSLLKFISIESVMTSNHLNFCHPLLLLPSIFHRVFSSELALCIRWPKYWSFSIWSLSISPSNECSGLDSFRIDWFDFHIVQGSLKNFLQHHYLKASVLWHSAFFMVQLSHPYITTGKTVALTIQTFVGKVLSVFFNMLSRFVIAFLPRKKHLLISWLQSLSAVILEPKKRKSVTVPLLDAVIVVFEC